MMRAVVAFLGVWALVFFGISLFWHSTRTGKVDFIKAGGYGLMTAAIALWLLVGIVYMF
jgi:hypothetical protein